MDNIIDKLPKMLVGEELHEKSLALPDYDDSIPGFMYDSVGNFIDFFKLIIADC